MCSFYAAKKKILLLCSLCLSLSFFSVRLVLIIDGSRVLILAGSLVKIQYPLNLSVSRFKCTVSVCFINVRKHMIKPPFLEFS